MESYNRLGANLEDASLQNADLSEANLEGAKTEGAIFTTKTVEQGQT